MFLLPQHIYGVVTQRPALLGVCQNPICHWSWIVVARHWQHALQDLNYEALIGLILTEGVLEGLQTVLRRLSSAIQRSRSLLKNTGCVQVLEAADYVVASNDDGGIAEAIERFIL